LHDAVQSHESTHNQRERRCGGHRWIELEAMRPRPLETAATRSPGAEGCMAGPVARATGCQAAGDVGMQRC
jgi:hypothetical protein